MRIGVVGLGNVGLPLAIYLVRKNPDVNVVGIDLYQRVNQIKNGIYLIEEGPLDDVEEYAKSERIKFSSDYSELKDCDAVFVSVGVDIKKTAKKTKVDYSNFIEMLEMLREFVSGKVVIFLGTLPIGTTENTILPSLKEAKVAYSPIHFAEGKAFEELRDFPVIYACSNSYEQEVAKVLSLINSSLIKVEYRVAEAEKIVENLSRFVNISFSNLLFLLFKTLGMDFREIRELANLNPRVQILKPGVGAGGHCIPYSYWFFKESFEKFNLMFLKLVDEINEAMPKYFARRISLRLPRGIIIIVGVGMKDFTPDTTESPYFKLGDYLRETGHDVYYFDGYKIPEEFLYKLSEIADGIILGSRFPNDEVILTELMKHLKEDCLVVSLGNIKIQQNKHKIYDIFSI